MNKTIIFNALHEVPLKFLRNHPACDVRINIGNLLIDAEFVIDTGAVISIIPIYLFREFSFDGYVMAEQYNIGGVGEGGMNGCIIKLNHFVIANYTVVEPLVFIPNNENWTIPMLGFDLLRGIYPYIDAKEKIVWFKRIRNAGETFLSSVNLTLKCEVLINNLNSEARA